MSDYTLPPVPDPDVIDSSAKLYMHYKIERYGNACAEAARAPLLARIAELEVRSRARSTALSSAESRVSHLRTEVKAKDARIAELETELSDWRQVRSAVAEIAGHDPNWPDHGNAPLAITASYALRKQESDRLRAEVAAKAGEVEALRADAVIEWEPGRSYTAAELLRRAIRGLRVRKGRPVWPAVMNLCGVGSTVGHHLCRWAGRDPDTGKDIAARKGEGVAGA